MALNIDVFPGSTLDSALLKGARRPWAAEVSLQWPDIRRCPGRRARAVLWARPSSLSPDDGHDQLATRCWTVAVMASKQSSAASMSL